MNPYRIFSNTLIILMILLFVCAGKMANAVENSIPVVSQIKTGENMRQTEVKPTIAKPKEGKMHAFQFSADLPDRNAIGCVLPLSGIYGNYGSKALDAILFAAGIFDEKNKTSWKIFVEDSRGLPEGVKAAVAHLARTENVIAIITVAGTLEAVDVAREAGKWKIPIILITSKEGVTSSNNYVFQHFLTPSQQIEALAKYALDDLNCAIFSILYPQDDYGTEMVKIFSTQADHIGGKVERAISYSKSQTDFTEEINKVTGNGIGDEKNANVLSPEAENPASIDFEAMFIPDSYQRVKMIVSQLAFYNLKNIKLLGTSLWNSPNLLKKDAQYMEGAVFADSFFAGGFYPETNDFVDIYYAAYSREPENIEALSYDTMGMIIKVLEDANIRTRKQFIDGLQQLKNYKGATGTTSFAADRVSRKTAFILRVNDGKLEQVK